MRHCARCWKAEGPTVRAPSTQPRTRTPPPPENTQTKTSEVARFAFTNTCDSWEVKGFKLLSTNVLKRLMFLVLRHPSCWARFHVVIVRNLTIMYTLSRNIDYSCCKDTRAGVVSAGRMTFMTKHTRQPVRLSP